MKIKYEFIIVSNFGPV